MFSITPLSFDVFSPMNPSNIGTNLILAESLGYIFVADSIDLSSFKFSQWTQKDARVLKHNDPSRSSILAPIESAYMTSYSTSIVSLVLLPRFRYYSFCTTSKATFSAPHPYYGQNLVTFPWSRPVMFGLQRANIPG